MKVQSHVNKCHSNYGKLPTKLAITKPWEALCVDLIGPYILKAMDKTQIDFMCITMLNTATSWFKIVELLVSPLPERDVPTGTKGQKGNDIHIQPNNPNLTSNQQ